MRLTWGKVLLVGVIGFTLGFHFQPGYYTSPGQVGVYTVYGGCEVGRFGHECWRLK